MIERAGKPMPREHAPRKLREMYERRRDPARPQARPLDRAACEERGLFERRLPRVRERPRRGLLRARRHRSTPASPLRRAHPRPALIDPRPRPRARRRRPRRLADRPAPHDRRAGGHGPVGRRGEGRAPARPWTEDRPVLAFQTTEGHDRRHRLTASRMILAPADPRAPAPRAPSAPRSDLRPEPASGPNKVEADCGRPTSPAPTPTALERRPPHPVVPRRPRSSSTPRPSTACAPSATSDEGS